MDSNATVTNRSEKAPQIPVGSILLSLLFLQLHACVFCAVW